MFSLIIPAYNEEKYIWSCLDFVLKNHENLIDEVIVIDNASTDKTYDIVFEYAKKHPIIRIVKEPQKWLTKARQRWYQEAKWDILGYIDADTRMHKWWASKMLKVFQSDEKIWLISGPYSYYDIPKLQQFTNWLYCRVISYPTYLFVWYVARWGNFAIKKSILDKINGFDTTIAFYGEDTDVARRASKVCKTTFILNLSISTSWRRFVGQWVMKTSWIYIVNYLSQVIRHKPASSTYKDFR